VDRGEITNKQLDCESRERKMSREGAASRLNSPKRSVQTKEVKRAKGYAQRSGVKDKAAAKGCTNERNWMDSLGG